MDAALLSEDQCRHVLDVFNRDLNTIVQTLVEEKPIETISNA